VTDSLPSLVRILLVENSPDDAALFRAWLEESDNKTYEIHHVGTVAGAQIALGKGTFQAIMLDLSLPDADELHGLQIIHNMAPTVPIIILTGNDNEYLALEAVESGAQDYLVKDKMDSESIRRAIHYAIHRKTFESSILHQANFDRLTGLANRMQFDSRLNIALGRTARSGAGIALLFLDLNGFKQINDTFGHPAGDQVLREIGRRISSCVRPYDTAARLGGDEFAVLVEGISEERDCMTVALKLIQEISAPITVDTQEVTVGVSIGIEACTDADILTAEEIINHADNAMYSSKLKDGSSYCFYTHDMEETNKRRIRMETELRKAIAHEELTLCYQPRQSLVTGKSCGVQALIRWNHPERGLMLPGEFIGIAQDIHMLEQIEAWVLRKVCQDIQRWHDMDLPFIQVSVHLSSKLFESPTFIKMMQSLIEENAIDTDQISLELPEKVFLLPDAAHACILAELYRLGISVTMNQFNIQTSSLQSLKAMALSEIKLGQDSVEYIGSNSKDRLVVKAIIGCAHSLGLRVIACGVESESLRDILKEERCDTIQGFIFSRPMPAAYLEHWLQNAGDLPLSPHAVPDQSLQYN